MAFAEPVVYARHQFYEACILFSHFSDEEIEAQRAEVAGSWQVVEVGFESEPCDTYYLSTAPSQLTAEQPSDQRQHP